MPVASVAQVDPETQDPFAPDGGLLGAVPLSKDGTFMRTIPEFKYWYRLTKAFAVAFSLTFFELFNVPVSRPILVMYFVLLFFQARSRRLRPTLLPRFRQKHHQRLLNILQHRVDFRC